LGILVTNIPTKPSQKSGVQWLCVMPFQGTCTEEGHCLLANVVIMLRHCATPTHCASQTLLLFGIQCNHCHSLHLLLMLSASLQIPWKFTLSSFPCPLNETPGHLHHLNWSTMTAAWLFIYWSQCIISCENVKVPSLLLKLFCSNETFLNDKMIYVCRGCGWRPQSSPQVCQIMSKQIGNKIAS
jgi:hypothetical protein